MPVAIPQPAATVVVVRTPTGSSGFEVLMVRRSDKVAFMGGAYVFPGGRVDENDAVVAQTHALPTGTRSRFPDLEADRELVYRVAAARELEEEAGVRVRVGDLVPFAHWVTPEVETRRYDTRFFLVEMPPNQEAIHDSVESTDLAWLSPADAIAHCLDDAILLPPPTWTTLKRLVRFTSIREVLGWAQTTRIVTIQPGFYRDNDIMMLTLPGDPTYPSIDGWEVPEDTRFLLREGKWRPVRA